MSTYSDPSRRAHLTSLHLQWHDSTIKDALTYLGFPVFFCRKQSTIFWEEARQDQGRNHISHSQHSRLLPPPISHPPFLAMYFLINPSPFFSIVLLIVAGHNPRAVAIAYQVPAASTIASCAEHSYPSTNYCYDYASSNMKKKGKLEKIAETETHELRNNRIDDAHANILSNRATVPLSLSLSISLSFPPSPTSFLTPNLKSLQFLTHTYTHNKSTNVPSTRKRDRHH